MKLLLCRLCADIVALQRERRTCRCGHVAGQYREDGSHADVSEDALVIGLDNDVLRQAVQGQHQMLSAWLFDRATAERVHWPAVDRNIARRKRRARQRLAGAA